MNLGTEAIMPLWKRGRLVGKNIERLFVCCSLGLTSDFRCLVIHAAVYSVPARVMNPKVVQK